MSFEGQGSENRLRKDKRCRHCGQTGSVYYTGSNVEHGNPFTPAADTEVTHYFHCAACDKHWEEYA